MEKIVVIGCGITGRLLSRLLMERDYQVVAIDDRRGGTWKFSGVAGVGYRPGRGLKDQFDVEVRQVIEDIATFFPWHIYSSDTPESVENYIRKLLTEARVNGLFHPLSGKTLPFLSVEGTLKPGITSWRSVLPFPTSGEVTILVPGCINGISTGRIETTLRDYLHRIGWNVTVNVEEVDLFCKSGFFSLLEVNRLFDTRHEYIQRLVEVVKERGTGTVFIPPILGVERWKENFEVLNNETGLNVSEIAAVEESPFGLRWEMECEGILEPVIKLRGRVTRYRAVENYIEGVFTENDTYVEGDKFILATGKFLSGGLVRDWKRVEEPIFSAPVFIGESLVIPEEDIQSYLGRNFFDVQPLWFAGVRRNIEGKVLNRWGEEIFSNLYAAGGVVEGVDYINTAAGISASLFSLKGLGFVNE